MHRLKPVLSTVMVRSGAPDPFPRIEVSCARCDWSECLVVDDLWPEDWRELRRLHRRDSYTEPQRDPT